MILADVFPVCYPRIIVQSPGSWTQYSSQAGNRYSKMWTGGDRQQLDKDPRETPRQYPNLIPIPDKFYFDRRDGLRRFPDSSFNNRHTNTLVFSERSAFRSSQMSDNIPKLAPLLEPSKSQLSFPSPRPGFLHMSQGFKPPSSITESLLRRPTPETTLQGTLFKRRVDLGESFHCPRSNGHVSSHMVKSSPFCSSRAVGLYRKQPSALSQNKKLYTCPQCKYVTDRKNNLKRHISTMHQDSAKILDCCGMVFRSKALLRDHVSLFHRAGYRCQYCGRNFCRKALLRRHLTVHSGQKDFTCPQCGYATSHKSNLERHRKIHDRKYSLNGEALSDTDSNDMSHYMDVMSSPSSSSESSPTESPQKYTHSHETEETSGPHTSTYRNAMPVRIKETHETGETTLAGEPNVHTSPPVSINHGFVRSLYSTFQFQDSGIGYRPGNVACPPPQSTPSQPMPDFGNPERKFDNVMERFSSTFMLRDRERKLSNRLFLNPYKCCDCMTVFSQQSLFNRHACRSENRVMLSPPISVVERKHKLAEKSHEIEDDRKGDMHLTVQHSEVLPTAKPTTDHSTATISSRIEDVDIITIDLFDVNANVDKDH